MSAEDGVEDDALRGDLGDREARDEPLVSGGAAVHHEDVELTQVLVVPLVVVQQLSDVHGSPYSQARFVRCDDLRQTRSRRIRWRGGANPDMMPLLGRIDSLGPEEDDVRTTGFERAVGFVCVLLLLGAPPALAGTQWYSFVEVHIGSKEARKPVATSEAPSAQAGVEHTAAPSEEEPPQAAEEDAKPAATLATDWTPRWNLVGWLVSGVAEGLRNLCQSMLSALLVTVLR